MGNPSKTWSRLPTKEAMTPVAVQPSLLLSSQGPETAPQELALVVDGGIVKEEGGEARSLSEEVVSMVGRAWAMFCHCSY